MPPFCSPPWTPFRGCWKSAAAAADDVILVEVDGQVPICGWHPYKPYSICLFVADILLSTMFLKFTHVVTYDKISFLLESWIIFHCMYLPHTTAYPFIHWWMFVCCFHLLTTVYSAAMNMSVQISVLFFFFNRRYPNGWRRKWLSTPVFLPGKFPGQRNLVGYSPWGRKESATTELTPQWYVTVVLIYTSLMRSSVECL